MARCGMNNREIDALGETLKRLQASTQATLLLIEHSMPLVMSISDTITVMHNGAFLAQGLPQGDRKTIPPWLRRISEEARVANGAEPSSAPALLSVDNLNAGYGKIRALHGVSLRVPQARIVCAGRQRRAQDHADACTSGAAARQ